MLLLYENLPLRTTRQLGDFADDVVLAHVFGDLTQARFPLARISDTRGHAADHAMEITGAGTGTTPTSSWAASIEPDITGHACTFVDFGAPVASGDQMWAYGRGARNAVTGALIANPADIMEYVCGLAGRSDRFQRLREECAAAAIALAGRIAAVQSIRAWLDTVAQCAGAIWCPGMGRLYPGPTQGYVLKLGVETVQPSTLAVDEVSDDTADILRLAYDQCDVTGNPQKHMQLEASPQRFGGLVTDLSLPMLRSPANAESIGRRVLQRMAGRRYNVAYDSSKTQIRPGMQTKIVAHASWPTPDADPTVMALAVDIDRPTKVAHVTLAEFQATFPAVKVTGHSIALPDTFNGSLEVDERNGIATFTVLDENKKGLPGARISLDGGAPKTTDASGQASFPYIAGHTYRIDIEAAGRQSQEVEWTL